MRKLGGVLLLAVLSGAWACAGENAAWQQLKAISGDWRSENPEPKAQGKPMTISYQVISNGSTIMETMKMADGAPFMVSMYNTDGEGLLMTHYCAAGNQPRLRSAALDGKVLIFKFVDITNLAKDATHINGLKITFTDPDHMVQEWSGETNGKTDVNVFRLVRVKPAQ